MNKIYILFLCLCYAVSAIMANTYKNDKEVTSPTDANIFGHVVDKATGEHLPGITIILKGTTIGSVTDDSGHYIVKKSPRRRVYDRSLFCRLQDSYEKSNDRKRKDAGTEFRA